MQTLKQKGFTLIELLVVIVIIGILATISVATFSGYFAKARDSERQAAVRNASTLLKTSRAVDTILSYGDTDNDGTATTPAQIATLLLDEGGFAMPAATTPGFTYHIYVNAQDFAVYTCSEEDGTLMADGTQGGINAITDGTTDPVCAATGVTAGTDADTLEITGS